jgi:Uncharacterized membrane protein
MEGNKVSVSNVLKFAGAFVACAIGSGFATGQEVMQFFSAQGVMSIIGTLVTTVIFSWCGGMFMKHGYEHQLESPGEIVQFYLGVRIGKAFEILFQIFLYGVYVIMIAGAGATLAEYFGLDPAIGRVGMAVLAFVTVILGLTKLTDILGSLGTVIILFSVGVGLYSFLANADGLAAAANIIPTLEITKTQGGWLWSSILYPGFNAMVVMILTCSMGRQANSSKEAFLGGMLGGVLFGAAILCVNLGILVNIADVYSKSVPTLVLAGRLGPVFGIIFSVIICCGIYTTTVPMLWGVVRHFAEDKSKKFVLIALGLTIIGLGLGMTSFKVLVNIIYPFSGYIGIMLFGFIACREYSDRKLRAKNGSGELAGSHISERENEIA